MSGQGFKDIFSSIFPGDSVQDKRPTTLSKQALRAVCAEKGHRYQVHGRLNPTKVGCSRCEVTWAIGPRTEPS